MRILTAVCLLLSFWSVIVAAIMLFTTGPDEEVTEQYKRSLYDMEMQIQKYDKRNREKLNDLHKDINELKVTLQNQTQYFHQLEAAIVKEDEMELDNNEVVESTNNGETPSPEVNNDDEGTPHLRQRVNASFDNNEPIAVLVIACNREIVSRSIDALLRYRPSLDLFPIIVSQDCEHEETSNVIDSYGDAITHIQQPDQSDYQLKGRERKMKGYYRIARHYKWALGQVFDIYGYNYAVIVEDDIEVAPDFFSYIQATRPLLATDRTLWCVSAWNDNGKEVHVDKELNDKLYRTDFFPGLGWMLTVHLWHELKDKWPTSYWDDWMRQEEQRKGRSCIRPEISRTYTFGKKGVSHGQYFERHLKYIILNENPYDFMSIDLNFLLEENYEETFVKQVLNLKTATLSEVLHTRKKEEIQIKYSNIKQFQSFAKHLKIMSDLRANIPRTAYKGIVSFRRGQRRIHLAPSFRWTSYQDIELG